MCKKLLFSFLTPVLLLSEVQIKSNEKANITYKILDGEIVGRATGGMGGVGSSYFG